MSLVLNHEKIFLFFFIYWLVLFFVNKFILWILKGQKQKEKIFKKKKKTHKQNTIETEHFSSKYPDTCGLIQMH